MHVIPRMARQPGLYLAHLMRAIVIHYQVNVKSSRQISVDILQKAQEFLMSMAPVAVADGDSAGHIQGRRAVRSPYSHPADYEVGQVILVTQNA